MLKKVRLTQTVQSGGCAAKLSPSILAKALCGLPIKKHPNLLVGLEKPDDAGIYKLSPDIAIIQTVDFFPPIVDDPFLFGQIAATNALSDIYAMGGKPITAMNVVGFPSQKFPITILREILKGGISKIQEAGAVLVGGHTINDVELKYGLAVTGIIHPDKIITNSNARVGDRLILTKPIGTGVFTSALKGGRVSSNKMSPVIESMLTLNRDASKIMQKIGVNACTDITGFSLIGHSYMMSVNSNVSIVLDHKAIPYFPQALTLSRDGFIPGGTVNNKNFYLPYVSMQKKLPAPLEVPGRCAGSLSKRAGTRQKGEGGRLGRPTSNGLRSPENLQLPEEVIDLLFDPQTSGGLLISVAPNKVQLLLKQLRGKGIKQATIIGEVIKKGQKQIIIN